MKNWFEKKVEKEFLPILEKKYGPFTESEKNVLVKKLGRAYSGGWIGVVIALLFLPVVFVPIFFLGWLVLAGVYWFGIRKRRFSKFLSELENDLKEGKISAYV